MTRYLITGASGMLGRDLQNALSGRDFTPLGHADLDITDFDAVREAMGDHDIVINAAAYTQVDDAEENEDEAFEINATGAENLAIAASQTGARLVHLSSDYVFDGTASAPYAETAALHPISAYGRTKAAGEQRVLSAHRGGAFVVRTAWLYGAHGPNFAKTMLRLAANHETVSVVNDQFGQPTWTGDLARQIVELIDTDASPGIYHASNSGEASWFDFAREIFRVAGLDPRRVNHTSSSEYLRPAPRPNYSVLGHYAWGHAGLSPMRNWKAALSAAYSAGALAIAP